MKDIRAYCISEACALSSTRRTALYEAIKRGELRAVKRGRRTLILADDLAKWLEALPVIREVNREAAR
jgi:excisionase family DNA binding protein